MTEAGSFVLTLRLLVSALFFNDLLGFLTFCFFGDLSPTAFSSGVGCGGRPSVARCGAQRPNHSFVILDAERRAVTTGMTFRHMTPTQSRTKRSSVRRLAEDHAAPYMADRGMSSRDSALVASNSLRCRPSPANRERNTLMSRYRVMLRRTSVEIVTADNPYHAAIVAADLFGAGVEVADARPAVGRAPATTTKKTVKKVAKKLRPMSPEARAKLAKNLVKARAQRARNLKAAKKVTKKRAAKKVAKKVGRPSKKGSAKRA